MTVLPRFGHLSGGLLNNRISWFCWLVFVSCQYFWFVSSQFHTSDLFNATFGQILSMLWLCLSLFFHFLDIWDFAKFAVDFFAHNLHFQVRLVEDECRAVAHHIRVIQASGTNNTKSTTELSPVLIRILLRVQTPEPRLHTRLQVGLPSTYPCIQG